MIYISALENPALFDGYDDKSIFDGYDDKSIFDGYDDKKPHNFLLSRS